MANHNPSARTFLFIVLGGIVIGFVIAVLLLGGNESETAVEAEKPAATQPAEAPAAAAEEPEGEMQADDAAMSHDALSDDLSPADELPDDAMSDDLSPPDVTPDDAMPDETMSDDVSPPDEMPDEAMPDQASDAMTRTENPEEPVSEQPAPAPNP